MNQLITSLPTIEHIPSSVDASVFNEIGSNRAATDYKQKDNKHRLRFIVAMSFF